MDTSFLQPFCHSPVPVIPITGLSNHTKHLKAGEAFFAYPGTHRDGRDYIADALLKKPAIIVAEEVGFTDLNVECGIPVILIPQLAEKVSMIASSFYQNPTKEMTLIGITGTNGKTTTSHLIYQAFNGLEQSTAVIGTLGVLAPDYQAQTELTTPDPIDLQKTFKELHSRGTKIVTMEVSSHALVQNRTSGLEFSTAVFSNLTRDHLDFHKTMEAYGQAKLKLFQTPGLKHAIVNADDPFSVEVVNALAPHIETTVFSTTPHIKRPFFKSHASLTVQEYSLRTTGIEAILSTPWGDGELRSKLIGRFNLSNLLATLAVLCHNGVLLKDALEVLSRVQPVVGRMQHFGGASMPQVIVDYAHTPDALQQALSSARDFCKRKLWCVFGCGGDRDQSKRMEMGKIASELADKVVITNDNPRNELPRDIIGHILEGVAESNTSKIIIEPDRKEAISYAIHRALSHDVILIAGKGHETSQTIGQLKLPFSDADCVKKLLSELT